MLGLQKVIFDFRRLLVGMWPNRQLTSCSISLFLSILAHVSLLMFGGTIPANKYKSSTKIGFVHPVIARHALVSFGSNMCACE